MTDNQCSNERSFYYNSGFRDGYHKAMDKLREFLFESYTVPDEFLKFDEIEDSGIDNE